MRFLLSIVALSLLSITNAHAQTQGASSSAGSALDRIRDSGELRVCLTGDYKPFSFLRADGQFEGTDVDLARSLATALKAKPRFVKTSWPTLLNDFTSGMCDVAMGGISVTLDRQMRAAKAFSFDLGCHQSHARQAERVDARADFVEIDAGVDERPEGHVAADPAQAVEVRNSHEGLTLAS